MQEPDREHEIVLPECAIPTKRVLVVRVDERSVDVQDGGRGYEEAAPLFAACAS
jgi:hypothetical protein